MAKIKCDPRSINLTTLAAKIDCAEMLSVPEQSSSPKIRLLLLLLFKIHLSSDISTAKEDSPLKILSLFWIRLNK